MLRIDFENAVHQLKILSQFAFNLVASFFTDRAPFEIRFGATHTVGRNDEFVLGRKLVLEVLSGFDFRIALSSESDVAVLFRLRRVFASAVDVARGDRSHAQDNDSGDKKALRFHGKAPYMRSQNEHYLGEQSSIHARFRFLGGFSPSRSLASWPELAIKNRLTGAPIFCKFTPSRTRSRRRKTPKKSESGSDLHEVNTQTN